MAKKLIMVVDDEPSLCKLVIDVLGGAGYKVVRALNGKECLEKLRKVKPDLILVDFFMPEMSGRELCVKIRADPKLENLKLAFLTVARFSAKGENELKRMGVLDYIQKPFDYKDLKRRVMKIVG